MPSRFPALLSEDGENPTSKEGSAPVDGIGSNGSGNSNQCGSNKDGNGSGRSNTALVARNGDGCGDNSGNNGNSAMRGGDKQQQGNGSDGNGDSTVLLEAPVGSSADGSKAPASLAQRSEHAGMGGEPC